MADDSLDWAKAAAAWTSQRKDGQTLPPPAMHPNMGQPQGFMAQQQGFMYPGMMHPQQFQQQFQQQPQFQIPSGFPPFGMLPQMMHSGGMNSYYPMNPSMNPSDAYFRPPPFPPVVPLSQTPDVEMRNRNTPQLPRWLAEAVKDKEGCEKKVEDDGLPIVSGWFTNFS